MKRSESLQQLSRDHHRALEAALKLRRATGADADLAHRRGARATRSRHRGGGALGLRRDWGRATSLALSPWKSARVRAEVGEQVEPDGCRHEQRGAQHRKVRGAVVEGSTRTDHQDPEADDRDRDAAVEAAGLGMRPWVEHPGDLAAGVGVGAVALARTGVADLCPGPIPRETLLDVSFDQVQALPLRALPGIQVFVVGEAGCPVELRAAMRVASEQVEPNGDQHEEQGVSGRQQALRRNAAHLAPTGCLGSVTSVKRISSGSSITSRLTVYRTPRYVR